MTEICYGRKDDERLYLSFDKALINIVEEESIDRIKYPIIIHEYKRMKISLNPDNILEDILEQLDDEYADPEGDYTDPTKKMKKAAEDFVSVIKAEYNPYLCEPTNHSREASKEYVKALFEETK